MDSQSTDILIIGGGLTGASLMLALANSPYRVMLVDAVPFSSRMTSDFDARSLALSPASVRILQMLDVWPLLAAYACPINSIHISERYGFGCAQLNPSENNMLGHVVELQHISNALHQRIDLSKVIAPAELVALDKVAQVATIRHGSKQFSIHAKLIVAADGTNSSVREFCGMHAQIKDYQQHAIVANIGLARSHQHIAYERFTAHGPLALLPMNGLRAAMVWALSPEEATRMMALSDKDFLFELQKTFGYRLGRLTSIGQRITYPLKQMTMPKITSQSVVFVGNAANTLHPVAGQGFNLGIRDVAMLAQCIMTHGLHHKMLTEYEALRNRDQSMMLHFTDGLIRLFTSNHLGLKFARRMGLMAFDQLPLFKTVLSRYARGFADVTPDLVCGIPLQYNPQGEMAS